jgi:hypothetical protein
MTMRNLFRRPIGQILLDGKLLSTQSLDRALDEQKHTRELLGQVLVRMGLLKPGDIGVPLLLQKHLNHIGDAVKVAAGERQLLGELLVHSGHISAEQLDQAIEEQQRSGEKIGEVLIRLGLLNECQLKALLDFQKHQTAPSSSPLRLGELLVATGHISREQLEKALRKQSQTGEKLGHVLVAEGYIRPHEIKHGIRLQKMLINSVLASILSLSMSSVSSASSVALQWDPNTESDLAGYKVYYAAESSNFDDAVAVDVQNQTTTTIAGLDPAKSYSFAVKAYNAAGLESSFSNVVVISETSAPTVAISSPATSSSVSGTVSISVSAEDNVGVTKVEFYVNGVLVATEAASPYVYSWNTATLASGTYTLTVKAYDAAGNVGESSKTVSVVNNDITAPTVALTAPLSNSIVSGTIAVSAGASDNVGVNMVELYANGVLLFASNASPYNFTWDTTQVANGSYILTARAVDSSGNSGTSSAVTVTVQNADTSAPTISAFSMPTSATSLTVAVSSFSASDNIGVTGYLITESATAPSSSASGWSSSAPTSFTFSGEGTKTAYAWTKDAAGNVSAAKSATTTIKLPMDLSSALSIASPVNNATVSATITVSVSVLDQLAPAKVLFYVDGALRAADTLAPFGFNWNTTTLADGSHTLMAKAVDSSGNVLATSTVTVTVANAVSDTTAPTISAFSLPTSATSLTVAVSSFSASDNIGVTGYLITESATAPSSSASGWSSSAPTSFTFSGEGTKTAYAWTKDAAGNVSAAKSATTTIKLPDTSAPTISAFSMPTSATSLTVAVSSFSASDNIGVTGYLITESATAPSSSASGWSSSAPTSFTFSGEGTKTAYAWTKDAAGNVSAAKSATTSIKLPDTTAPTISAFSMPTSATSLTVAVSSFSASDNIGVTGYLITESATAPSSSASGWSSSAPTSFTFSGEGTKTAYAWTKDAAGNVSAAKSATTTIKLPSVVIVASPADGATVSATVAIKAGVSTGVSLTKMYFYVDGSLRAADTKAPYSYNWNSKVVANGSHTILIKGFDSLGNIYQSSIAVTVKN